MSRPEARSKAKQRGPTIQELLAHSSYSAAAERSAQRERLILLHPFCFLSLLFSGSVCLPPSSLIVSLSLSMHPTRHPSLSSKQSDPRSKDPKDRRRQSALESEERFCSLQKTPRIKDLRLLEIGLWSPQGSYRSSFECLLSLIEE